MGSSMKSFNIFGNHRKIRFLGGSSRKTNISGKLPKKGKFGQFVDLRGGVGWGGGVGKTGGGAFEGGGCLIPQCTRRGVAYILLIKSYISRS